MLLSLSKSWIGSMEGIGRGRSMGKAMKLVEMSHQIGLRSEAGLAQDTLDWRQRWLRLRGGSGGVTEGGVDGEYVGEHRLAGGYLGAASWAGDQSRARFRKAGRRLEGTTWGKVAEGWKVIGRGLAMLVPSMNVCQGEISECLLATLIRVSAGNGMREGSIKIS